MRPTTRPICSWPRRARPSPTPCTLATATRRTNGKKYQLVVVQQPQRARMCGFGDKDRRPITPPPCVKLIVTDLDTGKESDFNAIEHGTFVLNVDLWSADGKAEVNLVRQTANSPSISSTISVPYQDNTAGAAPTYHLPSSVKSDAGPPAYSHFANDAVNSFSPQHQHLQTYNGQPAYHATFSQPPTPQQMYFAPAALHAASPSSPYTDSGPGQASPYPGRSFPPPDSHRMPATTPPQGMFTRNLIGSLSANASRLTDPEDKIGIWFVLQDLSVRTEGDFRLRFSFVNVSEISPPSSAHLSANSSAPLNKNKSPVLARCFSDVFSVYSAKRFPGVVESTPLSRCFATQGIRIPIRKDAAKGEKEKDEDED
ncbi:BgTH12-00421 [Blumeria graminis f. sp. triticale]|uniref:BgTH12-00421 n=1 Tax=Blumeria graminis f. sp. triticale TaxID=1689686 RepID=A0A9W4GHC2_BLUGR|nr:BgTH12-00421 [Blumeria graminis f. sp. triticale]